MPDTDALTGTWATGETTCAQQNAAVEAAGFTAEQMTLAGWSPDCGSQFTIRFADGRLLIFSDGEVGWDGHYRIIDDETFEAGDLDAVRSMVLDSPQLPDLPDALLAERGLNDAIETLARTCAADTACNAAAPGLADLFGTRWRNWMRSRLR